MEHLLETGSAHCQPSYRVFQMVWLILYMENSEQNGPLLFLGLQSSIIARITPVLNQLGLTYFNF